MGVDQQTRQQAVVSAPSSTMINCKMQSAYSQPPNGGWCEWKVGVSGCLRAVHANLALIDRDAVALKQVLAAYSIYRIYRRKGGIRTWVSRRERREALRFRDDSDGDRSLCV